ncbi:MAG TPA: hypothetical protein ENG69_04560 [Candidatus Korarchaeota archaeon]|nr:hypothetical protein [Candidatus Korarchaeota archaeon]
MALKEGGEQNICTVCGAREAVYHRRYSGESLCEACLRKSLEYKARRTIGRNNLLNRDTKAVILVRNTTLDSAALDLFLKIEEEFPEVKLALVTVTSEGVDYWRSALKHTIELARSRGYEAVVSLATLEEIDAINLLWLARRGSCLVIRGRLAYPPPPEGVDVVFPFYEVLGSELLASQGLRWEPSNSLLRFIESLEEEFPGSTYNMLRAIERLASLERSII